MNKPTDTPDFVKWFRASSPYINAHRGRTMVVGLDGETIDRRAFVDVVHDLALLASLGVRLILVPGAEPRIDARLAEKGVERRRVGDRPVTDETALACAREAIGALRIELEALFSTGLANTPMAGADIRVVSGNLLVARPIGVRDGVDFLHSGEVRRIETASVREHLASGAIVLMPPVGYSPTGEAFVLDADEVATTAAVELRADKLIFLLEGSGLVTPEGGRVGELSPARAEEIRAAEWCGPAQRRRLGYAIRACQAGVPRSHLVGRESDGALLQELFTRDGVGTLITSEHYDALRTAAIDDVGGVLQLIAPLEAEGVLVHRSREQLELEIDNFAVMERDGMIIACAALYEFPGERMGEIACVAVHPDYRNADRGEVLLHHLERRARARGLTRLAVLTTRTAHWFREQGFEPARVEDLPVSRRGMYNYQRGSKVFIKPL